LPAGIKKLAELLNYLGCKSVKIKRKGKGYRLWELPGSPESWRVPAKKKTEQPEIEAVEEKEEKRVSETEEFEIPF
jgi:hypothetical protein